MNCLHVTRRGISLLMVMVYISIVTMIVLGLLTLIGNRIIQGTIEARLTQCRWIAEAGTAKALAAYGSQQELNKEKFGPGYLSYSSEKIDENAFEVRSMGSIHNERSRIPSFQLVTRWRIASRDGEHTFELLARKEEIVP